VRTRTLSQSDAPARTTEPTPIRLLLVDDDPFDLGSLHEAVQDTDIQVVAATNDGQHAVELARVLRPDVALVAWDMGYFGGALTAWLIARRVPEVTTILLLDGGADEAAAAASRLAFHTITKDAPPSEIKQLVRELRWESMMRAERADRELRFVESGTEHQARNDDRLSLRSPAQDASVTAR
jgi:DNA-binding NarL/FixJ family response regulator